MLQHTKARLSADSGYQRKSLVPFGRKLPSSEKLNADGTRRCDWCTKRRPHLGPPPWPFDPPQPYSPPPPPTPRFTTNPPPLHNNPRNHLVLTIAAHTRPPSARSGFCWHRATAAISETGPFVSYCFAWGRRPGSAVSPFNSQNLRDESQLQSEHRFVTETRLVQ